MQQSGYFDYGLGRYVKNRACVISDVKRYGDVDPVEVGNEAAALRRLKPKLAEYDLPRGVLDGVD
jgi:hypothetical protein